MTKEEIAETGHGNSKGLNRNKRRAKGRMRNFLMFLPNMVLLLGRLLKDARVPSAEKALFLAAIIYVISPIDLIPDFFPFIGQVDDIYVVALTLLRLVNRSEADVVRQHWSGGGDIVALADSVAGIAPIILPKRVSRVLSSRVELGAAAGVLKGIKKNREPLLVEVPQPEKIEVDSRSKMTN
ncbi:MAG TPA: YkvA family protein [Pyrinomonadaceae bacterium]|nr:YkvA family protein [Pyrinomonadaceae bacterium]